MWFSFPSHTVGRTPADRPIDRLKPDTAMRNKSIFLLLACVCGTIAAVGASQWMQAQNPGETKIRMKEIFVTTKTIDVAEEITADKIRLEEWPADRIPEGSTSVLEDVEGKFARQRFYAGEPVMPVKLMNDANGTSQTIPRGYSVVSMRADPENAVANLVRPGDRVDVMAYFTKSDMIPETMAKTVLRGIRVFAVDGRTQRGDPDEAMKIAKTISLLIHNSDTEAWTYASELGKIRLTLGNPGEFEVMAEGEGNDAARQFLSWLADHQRAQAERLLVKKVKAPEREPVEPSADKAAGFKMLKMSNGKLTEYEWVAGQLVPVVVSETAQGSGGSDLATESPATSGGATKQAGGDYSYLNSADSPFFQPPKGSSPPEPAAPSPSVSDSPQDSPVPNATSPSWTDPR